MFEKTLSLRPRLIPEETEFTELSAHREIVYMLTQALGQTFMPDEDGYLPGNQDLSWFMYMLMEDAKNRKDRILDDNLGQSLEILNLVFRANFDELGYEKKLAE